MLATIGLFLATPALPQTDLYVLRSDDKGKTWSKPRRVTTNVPAEWIGTAADAAGVIYASTWRTGSIGRDLIVMRSYDRGRTWSAPSIVARNVSAPFPVIASDMDGTLGVTYMTPIGNKTIAVFARSSDGGVTWSRQTVAGPFKSGAVGFYQETSGGPDGFASVFIRSGPGLDGPTDVFVARIT